MWCGYFNHYKSCIIDPEHVELLNIDGLQRGDFLSLDPVIQRRFVWAIEGI